MKPQICIVGVEREDSARNRGGREIDRGSDRRGRKVEVARMRERATKCKLMVDGKEARVYSTPGHKQSYIGDPFDLVGLEVSAHKPIIC